LYLLMLHLCFLCFADWVGEIYMRSGLPPDRILLA